MTTVGSVVPLRGLLKSPRNRQSMNRLLGASHLSFDASADDDDQNMSSCGASWVSVRYVYHSSSWLDAGNWRKWTHQRSEPTPLELLLFVVSDRKNTEPGWKQVVGPSFMKYKSRD